MTVAPTAELLAEVFPGARTARRDYLEWLYEKSPFGPVVETNLDDDRGRIGHYAVVPIALSVDGVSHSGALSLNTAVHERARGRGAFTSLASQTYAKAAERGITAVVGVANANSTPGFLGRLGFELLGPLPVNVLIPTRPGTAGLASSWADAAFSPGGIATDMDELLTAPESGCAREWNSHTLRWRLASPGARYAIHRGEGVMAVSCVDTRRGVRVAILLKVFAAGAVPGRLRRALVSAACRFHRAPLALHVGVNDLAPYRGAPLPARLRDSPLNLIYRPLGGGPPTVSMRRFEFLDFDAY
jgi:GNAT superfamily N-acetyltransferase